MLGPIELKMADPQSADLYENVSQISMLLRRE
jgi:hypothetical protein